MAHHRQREWCACNDSSKSFPGKNESKARYASTGFKLDRTLVQGHYPRCKIQSDSSSSRNFLPRGSTSEASRKYVYPLLIGNRYATTLHNYAHVAIIRPSGYPDRPV